MYPSPDAHEGTHLAHIQRTGELKAIVPASQVRGYHLSRCCDRLDEREDLLHQVLFALLRAQLLRCFGPTNAAPSAVAAAAAPAVAVTNCAHTTTGACSDRSEAETRG